MQFADRHDAGRQLAQRLLSLKLANPMVLALPRGGVPVGFEIAAALAAPLDLVLVRKLGAPHQEEFAIGAIADGEPPELVVDDKLIKYLQVPKAYLEATKATAMQEIERRRAAYIAGRRPLEVAGHAAIVVDDGIATGATMLAALRTVRRKGPARLVLAVPVADSAALARLRPPADLTVCLHPTRDLGAVGQFYDDFPQLKDSEVTGLLQQADAERRRHPDQ